MIQNKTQNQYFDNKRKAGSKPLESAPKTDIIHGKDDIKFLSSEMNLNSNE